MEPSDYEYRGLMAASWDLLRGDTSQWADRFLYLEVIGESGEPVLDVGCGTGRLLLDYLAQGIEVEGVDNSPEMLARLREKAAQAGLDPVVYLSAMEDLSLPRRYRTILAPSSSFQLVTDPAAARQVLRRFYEHLEPGGTLALPFFVIPREPGMEGEVFTEDWRLLGEKVRPEDGLLLRYWGRSTYDFTRQLEHTETRYELVRDGEVVYAEDHRRSPADRWYSQEQARALLEAAGFAGLRFFHEFTRQPAQPGDTLFAVLAERPRERDSAYVSDIPEEAEAHPAAEGPEAQAGLVDYFPSEALAGRRRFDADGALLYEVPYRDGQQHGRVYRWEGRPHGAAYQWGGGRGAHRRVWDGARRQPRPGVGGLRRGAFARRGAFCVGGRLHGPEWRLAADGAGVFGERRWDAGQPHGIERAWNDQGRRRGYPRDWARGERVTRRQSLRRAAAPSLPPFRPGDNRPARRFPPEIERLIGRGVETQDFASLLIR